MGMFQTVRALPTYFPSSIVKNVLHASERGTGKQAAHPQVGVGREFQGDEGGEAGNVGRGEGAVEVPVCHVEGRQQACAARGG